MALSHRAMAVAVAALLLTGGVTGCSAFGNDSDPASAAAGSATGKAGVDNATDTVANGTFATPAAAGAKVDVGILGLKVSGRLATLNFQLTPRLPTGDQGALSPYDLNGKHVLGTSLIDPVNLKRYVVVKDSRGRELATDDLFTKLTNNQPGHLNATFAAPPENVKSVDVQIGSWPTFRNIPVER
ncbi:hypothetical protein GCM10022254_04410 [Actinomadura meridiana]|uniref:Lipoprotein n=1 Tax=Actinomadura meridiana TaxID=559626 RepID=A0ABP8BSV7_9ACTN